MTNADLLGEIAWIPRPRSTALRRLGVHVRGIVGSSHTRAEERAAALNLPPAYESFEAMLGDPRVGVVHITSPNRLHFPQVAAALAAGKHVVCEKPLAMNSKETAALVKLASRLPQVFAVNYNVRFYPLCLEARERVRTGMIGDVFHITGSYLQDWLLFESDYNWRVEDPGGCAPCGRFRRS